MDERKDLGKAGEQLAVEHLVGKGFMILERNWHFSHKEIDIIAREGNDIVVVEVKTRNAPVLELQEQAVNRQKRQFLISAANAYVKYKRIPLEVRFDVINVVYSRGIPEVSHIRNAFFPTLW
jgi:putative endonuclease